MPSYSFACQTSYLTSMAQIGFDFNSCIYDGISYISRAQESSMKHLTGNSLTRAHAVQSSSTLSIADSVFIQRIKSRIKTWINVCKDSKGTREDPMVKALRKIVEGDHGSRPCIDVDVCSERQVQLVLENGSTQGVRIVFTSSNEDKDLYEKQLQDLEEEQSKNVRGFREVIDLISASRKPIVAHNSLDDFSFIHSKFMSPLPLSLDQFKSSLSSSFPYIIDLGHLMKEFNPNGNINNVPAASSFLRRRFFAPIVIDIPLKGTPDEMNEGKIYGHNVLQISHVFAKLYSITKYRQQKEDASLTLDNFANIFDQHSSPPLDNSDQDIRISSSSIKKLSCDDVAFLWGFRCGLSAVELKELLSKSHKAFSDEFDVQLVDKSCAVVAFWKPGIAAAFINAMASGGDCDEGLKELISEGFKATNYETYKCVCNTRNWNSNLADSLDQAVASAYRCPVDDHEKSPYEIWWDDKTVLNLDDI